MARFEAPRPGMKLRRLALRLLKPGFRLLRPELRLLRPDLRLLRPDLRPLRPGLKHLRRTDAQTHGKMHRTSVPSVPFGAAAQKQLSMEKSYQATSRNSVTQYLLRHSEEGFHSKEEILLLLSFLKSSHLLHYYMDGVFSP